VTAVVFERCIQVYTAAAQVSLRVGDNGGSNLDRLITNFAVQ
jgi:hypothetical protein